MTEILLKEETYVIMGAAFEVYNQLGSGFLEAVYQEALDHEFRLRAIPVIAQQQLRIFYKDHLLEQVYRPDYVAYNQIVIELKAIKQLTPVEVCQLFNYLKATNFRLGLLINFGSPHKLEWKRIVR